MPLSPYYQPNEVELGTIELIWCHMARCLFIPLMDTYMDTKVFAGTTSYRRNFHMSSSLREAGAGGSNPLTPTSQIRYLLRIVKA